MDKPVVSVIIPCLNEEKYIGKCLDSVVANDYPKDCLEILVVDGMSSDGTRDILAQYERRYSYMKVLQNPKTIIPAALNVGIKAAKGEIILRLDAHTTYGTDYFSKCVESLQKHNADNVGGVLKTVAGEETLIAKAIALVLSHPFGVGSSHFRTRVLKEPRYVDTVAFGCFRKEIFDKIGLYDEALLRSEDMNFNQRLRGSGGKIMLIPDIVMYYHAKSSVADFVRHTFSNGYWLTYPVRIRKLKFSWRHNAPLLAMTLFLAVAGAVPAVPLMIVPAALMLMLYGTAALYFSFRAARRERIPGLVFVMPFIFFLLHVMYALGSLWGIVRISLKKGS